jgi:D-serine deaminase-like pyridoxal phosphate-dependent protein
MESWPLPVRLSALGAIECNALEHKGHDRAHASSARKVRVALAAIANSLAPLDFKAVTCDRAHISRSSAIPMIEHTRLCDRAPCL